MKIGIVGAGFTGLAAAYKLQKNGHDVTLVEKDDQPGGLAIGYKEKSWQWTLEHHYHHWFTNDDSILSLAREINYPVITKRPKTSVYINNRFYQLDSPTKLLTFPLLSLFERLRMATVFALLFRFNPFWKPLEKIKTTKALPKLIGKKPYELIWEPQLVNKLKSYVDEISLVWFWARIKKRTTELAYPESGFLRFALYLARTIEKAGGKIFYRSETVKIFTKNGKPTIEYSKNGKSYIESFDKVLVTLPTPQFLKITPSLPKSYTTSISRLKGMSATNLVLRLKNKFLKDNTYWLSICEKNSNVMVVVEHTNFMDKKNYNDEHLVYIGNYMEMDNPVFNETREKLLDLYDPLLRKINPQYKKDLIDYKVFRAPFAQPIVPANYSKFIPSFTTPLKDVYLANMQQVYPWDRGTNYAVELGVNVAKLINTNS